MVLLTDVKEDELLERKKQLEEGGGPAHTCVADVTDIASIKEMVQEIEKDGLRIDMLLNNAGYQGEFKKVITINLIGAFNVL